jgi:heme exporter protein A
MPPSDTPPSASDILIAVDNLTKMFGLQPALRGLSFTVSRGTVTALLGPNGSGKTTLLRILSALSTPTAGKVTIGGWSLPKEAAAVRAQLGVISHAPLLYDDLTAAENLRFYGRLYGCEDEQRIAAVLDRVGLARRVLDVVRTYSRGMVQRLAIARAILHDPAVLLLDEPYTGLDAYGESLLDELLHQWRAERRTVILSLHDIPHAALISDRALILRAGKLVADVNISEISEMSEAGNLPALFKQVTA